MKEENNQKQRCPVCHMIINKDSFALEYLACVYAFCSQQCRERFEANPHLYIGMPGHPSPKQQGHELIKKRSLKLNQPLTENQSRVITSDLENMMGIKEVHIESDSLYITYDLMQATVEQIEAAIEKTGEKLVSGLGEKLKRAFIYFLEETELDNLEQPGNEYRH